MKTNKKHILGAALWCLASFLQANTTAIPKTIEPVKHLTEIAAASGFEKPVREYLQEQWKPYMNQLQVDGMGNLIGQHKNNQLGPHLLLMAHMDEVGLMVESITEEGFLRVVPLGGTTNSVLYAQNWNINTENGIVKAYSGMDSPHILSEAVRDIVPDKNHFFLDIGAVSRAHAQKKFHIRPGLAVTPDSHFKQLSDKRFLGKALDDRIGLAAISEALNQLKRQQPNQLIVAATVQEEVGLRGASTIYESSKADVAINVEVGIADDYPMLNATRKNQVKLGKGPSLFVYDKSMIPNQALVQWIMNLAYKNKIPLQLELETGYGEDGAKVQTSGSGVPTINLGIPIRYAHQHEGVFDIDDYQNLVKLLTLIVENLGPESLKIIHNG